MNTLARKYNTRNTVIGIIIGFIVGYAVANKALHSLPYYSHKVFPTETGEYESIGRIVRNSYFNVPEPVLPSLLIASLIGLVGGIIGYRLSNKIAWKEYKSGWGVKIPGGDKEHISVSKMQAEVGHGFHITIGNNRIYFDNKGNCLGEGNETHNILTKVASLYKRGLITEKEYDATLERLSDLRKNNGLEI